jgi:dihydroneopterin aldolase
VLYQVGIRGLRVVAVHGALAEERERAQPFSLDADVWVRAPDAGRSDALEDTADYGRLVAVARAILTERSFTLLEAAADAVARGLLDEDDRIARVRLTLTKVRPPLPYDVESVGVTVEAERS